MKLSNAEIETIRTIRWRARTDLLFLCNYILAYPDVCRETHGPILDRLQKFQKPTDEERVLNDYWDGKTWRYKPVIPHQELPGVRRMLLLDPRSHLKTTLNTTAHLIQFIINYPNMATMISVANTERARIIMEGILNHWIHNPMFRKIFPEHCPPANKAHLFGRQDGFTTLARDFSYEKMKTRNEPTVHVGTIEKAVAGLHFDVIKFSDVVDEENSQTREQCAKIAKAFADKQPAVVNYQSWVYVEGTRYHNDDLYGQIIAAEEQNEAMGRNKLYSVFMRGCFKRHGETYDLSDLDKPFVKDPERVSKQNPDGLVHIFHKMPAEALLDIKYDAVMGKSFNAQYLNDPTDPEGSPLPVTPTLPATIKHKDFRKVKIAYYEYALDLAETTKAKSDFSAHTIIGWSNGNRPFIVEIKHGKFNVAQNIAIMLDLYKKYRPARILLEDMPYTVGLFVSVEKAFQSANLFPYWEWVKRRGTGVQKGDRIGGALEVWWKSGELKFLHDDDNPMEALPALKREARSFPKGAHDDILDTLADLMTNKTLYFGRLGPRHPEDPEQVEARERALLHGIAVEQHMFGWASGENTVECDKYGGF